MTMLPDCPEIAMALATGYPHRYEAPTCEMCGCDFGRYAYEHSGYYYCEDCARFIEMELLDSEVFENEDGEEVVECSLDRVDVSDITF